MLHEEGLHACLHSRQISQIHMKEFQAAGAIRGSLSDPSNSIRGFLLRAACNVDNRIPCVKDLAQLEPDAGVSASDQEDL